MLKYMVCFIHQLPFVLNNSILFPINIFTPKLYFTHHTAKLFNVQTVQFSFSWILTMTNIQTVLYNKNKNTNTNGENVYVEIHKKFIQFSPFAFIMAEIREYLLVHHFIINIFKVDKKTLQVSVPSYWPLLSPHFISLISFIATILH